ncbi:MAG: DegT/DnrJ/EryC1/StrS aminotransferase family protein [bacterium]
MSLELAIEGGTPVREKFLPFCQPNISKEEIDEVVDTLNSDWITTGPKTKEFEKRFAQYVGAKYALAVSSATAGMHLSLIASGIGKGDEVITTPYTFAATANVIIHSQAKPVFVDINKDTFNIEPAKIEEAITHKTKAIIPVHFAGQSCQMDEILQIAKRNKLVVIEDAAHAVSSEYKGKKIGSIGDVTAFSFYATKNLTTGEGGMVTTNDDELADKIAVLSLHGISKDAWKRYGAQGSWYYEILYPGFKYNMTDIQASIGLHQLAKIEEFLKIRLEYVKMYQQAFKELPQIITPQNVIPGRHVWHLYCILINLITINRDKFIEALASEGIGTSVHFIPIHLHPFYQNTFGFKKGDFPNAEWVYEREISLPLHPKLTKKDVKDVILAVKKIVDRYK